MKTKSNKLAMVGGILLSIFILLNFAVFAGYTQPVDDIIFKSINGFSSASAFDTVMIAFSLYGREVFWLVLIVCLLFFGDKEQRKTAMLLVLLFIILVPVGLTVKIFEYRTRPYEVISTTRLLVPTETDSSFPSGHTLFVAGGAALVWVRMKKRWAFPIALEAASVSFSRIYVGVHYPSDVLGGILLGVSVALLLMSYLSEKKVNQIFSKSRLKTIKFSINYSEVTVDQALP